MFADMYENPGAYLLSPNEIDTAMNGKTWRQAHIAADWNKQRQRLATLDEIERTNLPHIICTQLITYLQADDTGFYMSKAHFDKFFVNQTMKKCKYKITQIAFYSILERCGLQTVHKDDREYFTNDKYPLMFDGIMQWQTLLSQHRKGKTKYLYDSAFNHLDHRFFEPDHVYGFENSQWYMSDVVIAYLSEINNFAEARGKIFSKLDNTLRIAIGFRLKGNGFFEFEHQNTYPTMQVKLFHSDSAECREFENKVNNLPNAEEVKTTILKWVRRCYRCPCRPVPSAGVIGNKRIIFGREMKLCGPYLNLLTTDFSQKSLAIMKTILELV